MVFANVIPKDLSSTQVDARLKKVNGDAGEYIMNKVFKKNGWKQLEGEVSGKGIDGLFVKYDKSGNVRQVMTAESKYGNAVLGTNKYGTSEKNIKQMSKKGLLHQINNLIKNSPEGSDAKAYNQIRRHIEADNYRSRLFQTKINGNTLSFEVKKILPNGEISILKKPLLGRENYKINGLEINLDNPKTEFEKNMVKYNDQGRLIALQKRFGLSSLEASELAQKKGKLLQSDIEKVIGNRRYVYNSIEREYRSTLRKFNNRSYGKSSKLKIKVRSEWKKYFKLLKKGMK